jgi:hypothetical protein
MSSPLPDWWIAPAGLRAVETDPEATAIPDNVLADPDLSLMAKGIYALVLTYQGQPINPYDDAVEDPAEIADALDELVLAGLIVRVSRPGAA